MSCGHCDICSCNMTKFSPCCAIIVQKSLQSDTENQHTVSPYMRKLMEEESVAKSKQKENDGGNEEEESSSTEDISSEIKNSNGIGDVNTEKKSSPESKHEPPSTSEVSASGTDSKTSQKANNEDKLLGNFDKRSNILKQHMN